MTRKLKYILLCLMLLNFTIAGVSEAAAYLDPGTGSIIFQSIVAVAATGLAMLATAWKNITGFFVVFLAACSTATSRNNPTRNDRRSRRSKRCRAKWRQVRVGKTRPNKRQGPVLIQSEPGSRSLTPQIFYGGVPISRKSRPA
jgi:hypothetical protein